MITLLVEEKPMAEMLHLQLPCPSCDEAVHVVADPDKSRSRWACLNCKSVGEAPFVMSPPPPVLPFVPVAQA